MEHTLSRISTLLFALALVSAAGCAGEEGPKPGVVSDASYACTDEDMDGFGVGCLSGEDCDDTDSAITNQCRVCLDSPIREGCACEPQMGVECVPPAIPHPEGLLICREGTRFCRDGVWTACEPLGEYVLVRN